MIKDVSYLNKLSLDLDNSNFVKSAGVVQNISNYLKKLFSPEYKSRAKELAEKSHDVSGLFVDLSRAIKSVQESINDADIESYEEGLIEVRTLVGELSQRLQEVENEAQKASVIEPEATEEPQIVKGYRERHRPGYNVPIGDNLKIPFNQSDHFQNVEIYISDKSKIFNINRYIIPSLNRQEPKVPWKDLFSNSVFIDEFFNKLYEGIKNGTVYSNEYAPNIKAEGVTRVTVHTENINVSGVSFKASVVLTDLWAQAEGSKKLLSIYRIPKIWDVKVSDNIVPKSGAGKSVLFLSVPEYYLDEKSKNEILEAKEYLRKDKKVDLVIDVPVSKIDVATKQYVDQGYDIAGVETYSPKVSSSARKTFIMKIAQAPWWQELLDEQEGATSQVTKKPVYSGSFPGWGPQAHKWARDILIKAFRNEMGRDPTLSEIQMIQAVALGESGYGQGWKGPGVGSNNWGAIQCVTCPNKGKPKNGKCPPGSFLYTDSRPTKSGKNVKFQWCYKSYSTPEAGARDLIKTVFKSTIRSRSGDKSRGYLTMNALENNSIVGFSSAMYDTYYYGGFGKDRAERVAAHAKYMANKLDSITEALGEKPAFIDYNLPKNLPQQLRQQNVAQPDKKPQEENVMDELKELEKVLWASFNNESKLKIAVQNAISKKMLPKSKIIITTDTISNEYLSFLSNSLKEVLSADVEIKHAKNRSDVVCFVPSVNDNTASSAVDAVCKCASEVFESRYNTIVKTSSYAFVKVV